jgi:hypothetical protein
LVLPKDSEMMCSTLLRQGRRAQGERPACALRSGSTASLCLVSARRRGLWQLQRLAPVSATPLALSPHRGRRPQGSRPANALHTPGGSNLQPCAGPAPLRLREGPWSSGQWQEVGGSQRPTGALPLTDRQLPARQMPCIRPAARCPGWRLFGPCTDWGRVRAWFKTCQFQVTPEIDRALIAKEFLVLGVTPI